MKREYAVTCRHLDAWFINRVGYSSHAEGFSSKRRAIRFAEYVALGFGCSAYILAKNFSQEIEWVGKKVYKHPVLQKKLKELNNG